MLLVQKLHWALLQKNWNTTNSLLCILNTLLDSPQKQVMNRLTKVLLLHWALFSETIKKAMRRGAEKESRKNKSKTKSIPRPENHLSDDITISQTIVSKILGAGDRRSQGNSRSNMMEFYENSTRFLPFLFHNDKTSLIHGKKLSHREETKKLFPSYSLERQ